MLNLARLAILPDDAAYAEPYEPPPVLRIGAGEFATAQLRRAREIAREQLRQWECDGVGWRLGWRGLTGSWPPASASGAEEREAMLARQWLALDAPQRRTRR